MTTLNTRQTFILAVLFVVTSLAFIQLDSRRALDPVKDAMRAAVGPIVAQVGNAGRRGDVAMEREIASVKAERDQLAAENAQLKAAVREVEQLRQVMGELQIADVRAQVALSLVTDFENWSTFKPAPRHEHSVDQMLDQVVAWSTALKAVREPALPAAA